MIENQSSGHFIKLFKKVIVSDYRYFLFGIYDLRLMQLIDVVCITCFAKYSTTK
jgi:hypothetical protein